MNEEKQRIAIAEACGWERCGGKPGWFKRGEDYVLLKGSEAHREAVRKGADLSDEPFIPDYFNDLNAMHEAERKLTIGQWSIYLQELRRTVAGKGKEPVPNWDIISRVNATAAQRAEAFLWTLGKWEEEE